AHVKDYSDPRTIVSAADLASEEVVFSVLRPRLNCSFLSEERGETYANGQSEYRIIVDPLDGSKNFAQNSLGLFGISIGVEKNDHLLAGAIYLPYFRELLAGERGRGVYFGTLDGAGQLQLQVLTASVSGRMEF